MSLSGVVTVTVWWSCFCYTPFPLASSPSTSRFPLSSVLTVVQNQAMLVLWIKTTHTQHQSDATHTQGQSSETDTVTLIYTDGSHGFALRWSHCCEDKLCVLISWTSVSVSSDDNRLQPVLAVVNLPFPDISTVLRNINRIPKEEKGWTPKLYHPWVDYMVKY